MININKNLKEKSLRKFNKRLAYDIQAKLKAKSPDISAAFVLHTLLTWKTSRRHMFGGRVAGCVYLSLSKIQKDLPWLSCSAINDAISRLEKAFGNEFHVDRQTKREHNFVISEKLIKAYFTKNILIGKGAEFKYISVRSEDAVALGVLSAALISNLEYKTSPKRTRNPLTDAEGRIYGEMSASVLSSPSKRKAEEIQKDKLPILPFSRQAIQTAISQLVRADWFVAHPNRTGFYRLNRPHPETETVNFTLKANCEVVSSDSTELSPNRIELSTNRKDYIGDIENKIENRLNHIESDICYSTATKGRSVEFNACEILFNQHSPTLSQPFKPMTIEETFPGLMEDVNLELERYREWRKSAKLEVVHPSELPYDIIIDPVVALWTDSELTINHLTEKPVDFSNFDELIDLAVDELDMHLPFDLDFDLLQHQEGWIEIRRVFYENEGLTATMVQTMFERIYDAQHPGWNSIVSTEEPSVWQRDDQYFAKIVTSPKLFVRYFKQLFVETFAPYINKDGEDSKSDEGVALRSWTVREQIGKDGVAEYPTTYDIDVIEEPFKTLFKTAIEKESLKL
jgi:hypothetical protein